MKWDENWKDNYFLLNTRRGKTQCKEQKNTERVQGGAGWGRRGEEP